jgi:hypothetical protein
MSEENKLLMMFIADMYSSSGKIKKETARATMKYVGSNPVYSDRKSILDYTPPIQSV